MTSSQLAMILERRSSSLRLYHEYNHPAHHVQKPDTVSNILVLQTKQKTTSDEDNLKPVDCRIVTSDVAESSPPVETCRVYGLLGIFHLPSGPYAVAITDYDVNSQGIGQTSLYCVTAVRSFALPQNAADAPKLNEKDQLYLRMIDEVVATRSLYFADNYDITHTIQRQATFDLVQQGKLPTSAYPCGAANGRKEKEDYDKAYPKPALPVEVSWASFFGKKDCTTLWGRCDVRYCWNRHLVQPLLAAGAQEFAVCVMNGFAEHKRNVVVDLGGKQTRVDLFLFSRRSCRRQGTRFNVRGIEDNGDVANFVETEQVVVQENGTVSSFVQIRGSIPLIWSQPPTMKYTPKVAIGASEAQTQTLFKKHFSEQFRYYGDIVAVNLIDQKGDQLSLGRQYKKHADNMSDDRLSYVWFDFHKECAKMQWQNLSKLMTQVQYKVDSMDQFIASPASDNKMLLVSNWQNGVVRTNCIDNLDRTNVVQSLLARGAIMHCISGAHVPDATRGDDVVCSPYLQFESVFKNLWGDNADALSFLYSGTGALKTDFTRTGKRSTMGAIADGWNSVKRYVLNNMSDGRTQDAWDFFLGRFCPAVENGVPPPDMSAPDLSSQQTNSAVHLSHRLTRIRMPPREAEKHFKRELTPARCLQGTALVFAVVGTLISTLVSPFLGATGISDYPGFLSHTFSLLWSNRLTGLLFPLPPVAASHHSQWWQEAVVGFGSAAVLLSGFGIFLTRSGKPAFLSRLMVSRPHYIEHDLVKSQKSSSQDSSGKMEKIGTKSNIE